MFWNQKKALPVPDIPSNALAVMESAPAAYTYTWQSEPLMARATAALADLRHAQRLGLQNQAELNAAVILQSVFEDSMEASGAVATPTILTPLSPYGSAIYRVDDGLDLWQLFPLDNKLVRLPHDALVALDRLLDFNPLIIQERGVLQKVGVAFTHKELRGSDKTERLAPIENAPMLPDPLLVVKVAGAWFCIAQWE